MNSPCAYVAKSDPAAAVRLRPWDPRAIAKREAGSRAFFGCCRRFSLTRRAPLLACVALVALTGCDALPPKPDVFFTVYRERMAGGKIEEARALLTPQSRNVLAEIYAKFKSATPPERTALLDALDSTAPPAVLQEGDGYALLQLRTKTGGMKTLHLVRPDPKSHWRLDLSEELHNLKLFLDAKGALEAIREQAGDYAAFYRAVTDRLEKAPQEESTAPRSGALDEKDKEHSLPHAKAGKIKERGKGRGEK